MHEPEASINFSCFQVFLYRPDMQFKEVPVLITTIEKDTVNFNGIFPLKSKRLVNLLFNLNNHQGEIIFCAAEGGKIFHFIYLRV